jgi:radical SAM superfamily enzyme YgiQ (UPF0313 family)
MSRNVLLVYPEMPATYWSFRYTLPFIGKKASLPPVGLLTVAAMLPEDYHVKLVDMNVSALKAKDIMEADIVMTSSMIVQKRSLEKVIELCNELEKPVVAGGPYPTSSHEKITGVSHFVLNEAEVTLPQFLSDYEAGQAKPFYSDEAKPDITKTPAPRFDLIDTRKYASMALQYSRGCPFSCEFCDIVAMFGHTPRTKTPEQFVAEMERLYEAGYRGSLFVVDDNFIGNKKNVKELLPAISDWQAKRKHPFKLFTEASVNLAADEELMDMMVEAGFGMVFLGIETPSKESLIATHKMQNAKSDLLDCVHKIQKKGMEVTGGFIVGFDSDPEDIFERQIHFIQKSGVAAAMVGLLTALPNTQLFQRLKAENRLVEESSGGNNTDLSLNFLPKMDMNKLLVGYKKVISEIYKPEMYFHRCLTLLKNLAPHRSFKRRVRLTELRALVLSLLRQTFSFYGWHYVKFISKAAFTKPALFSEAIAMAVKGHHFLKITKEVLAVDKFKAYLEKLSQSFHDKVKEMSSLEIREKLSELTAYRDHAVAELRREYQNLHVDFQPFVDEALRNFENRIDEIILELSAAIPQPVPVKIS